MKLIIQVPCYNEAQAIATTVAALPRTLPGIDCIEIAIIDDGSSDTTLEIVRKLGVNYITTLPYHQGLAKTFIAGLETCLRHGADIIVNIDADNQYRGEDIEKLITPIIERQAQISIGDRGIAMSRHFPLYKRILQRVGSWIVSQAAGISIPDATSGFRAYSREAALRTRVLSNYTFTLETLIQAGAQAIPIVHIPIETNPQTRPSRLMRSSWHYLWASLPTLIRAYTFYRPLRFFTILGSLLILAGLIPGTRFLYFYIFEGGIGHIQSLILAAIFIIVGFQVVLIGFIADLISANRQIIEEMRYQSQLKALQKEQQS
jgi:glycosyltransferase involved in cell wall biosynthesis